MYLIFPTVLDAKARNHEAYLATTSNPPRSIRDTLYLWHMVTHPVDAAAYQAAVAAYNEANALHLADDTEAESLPVPTYPSVRVAIYVPNPSVDTTDDEGNVIKGNVTQEEFDALVGTLDASWTQSDEI